MLTLQRAAIRPRDPSLDAGWNSPQVIEIALGVGADDPILAEAHKAALGEVEKIGEASVKGWQAGEAAQRWANLKRELQAAEVHLERLAGQANRLQAEWDGAAGAGEFDAELDQKIERNRRESSFYVERKARLAQLEAAARQVARDALAEAVNQGLGSLHARSARAWSEAGAGLAKVIASAYRAVAVAGITADLARSHGVRRRLIEQHAA